MSQLLADVAELTPARLTAILTRQGVLPRGEAVEVSVIEEAKTPWSQVYHLKVIYSADAPAGPPRRLFLKMGQGGEAEVTFYRSMARAVSAALPVVPCYEAAWSPATERSHLLLLDLADTHGLVAPWPMPPLRAHGEAVVGQLAKFHAYWWEHPGLGKEVGELQWNLRSEQAYRETIAWRREAYGRFASFLGDRLGSEHRRLYEEVIALQPTLWDSYWCARVLHARRLTLIHGDCHPGNLLYPRDPGRSDIYLVDWQGCRIATGTTDLAYMVSLHWYGERDRAWPFLQCYYRGLLENGVQDCTWDDFCLDYAVAVTEYLFDPIRLYDADVEPLVWWPILQKGLVAYRQFQSCLPS
jgi:thiamine kinase-like enzyme